MKTKSILLAVGIILAIVHSIFAQATFRLQNLYPSYGINAPVFDGAGSPLAGSNYVAELWGARTPDALRPAGLFRNGYPRFFVPFISGGYFISGEGFLNISTVQGYSFAWLQVRAWDTRLGATYEEVSALGIGGYGESPLFYAKGGDATDMLGVPAPLIGLQSFSLRPIPEPSTWALLASGGTMLYCAVRVCRKKQTW